MKSAVGLSLPEYSFNSSQTVLVIGAGLAGCAIANAMAKRGYSCRVYDQHSSVAGATSALPAAVVRPAVNGDAFFTSYFDYAFDLCRQNLGHRTPTRESSGRQTAGFQSSRCSLPNQSSSHQRQDDSLFTQCGSLELSHSPGHSQRKDNSQSDNKNHHPHHDAIYRGTYKREFVDAEAASTLAGTTLASETLAGKTLAGTTLGSSAIHIEDAGFVHPPLLCNHWLQHEAIEFHAATSVAALRKTQHGWELLSASGAVIDESPIVILATAEATNQFDVAAELPLQKAIGQIDRFAYRGSPLQCIVNGNGYLLPVGDGIWSGATHRPVKSTDGPTLTADGPAHGVGGACAGDHPDRDALDAESLKNTLANKASAARMLPDLSLSDPAANSFAAIRTFTPDRLPIVGALHDRLWYCQNYADLKHGKPAKYYPAPVFHQGLYLAAGLGSRGATQALLIGELMADLIAGSPHPRYPGNLLHRRMLQALHPARFLTRALKRGS